MTFSPLLESSAPVGSSARMMLPPFMSARAMETRCCWPPESSLGLFSSLSGRPRSASRDWPGQGAPFVHPGVYGGKGHVFRGGQRGEQVVALEDEPDALPAQFRELVAVQRADVHAADAADPGRLGVEAAQDVHERRLARSGLSDDGDEIAFLDGKGHVFSTWTRFCPVPKNLLMPSASMIFIAAVPGGAAGLGRRVPVG